MIRKNEIIIQALGIKKKYGNFTAVDGISFDILKGEIFGFLGPNGAGKTTSINMICGLSKLSEGSVRIFGKKITDKNEIKTHLGVCPQENIFWPKLTCHEQLSFMGSLYGLGSQKARNRSSELLLMMGLEDKRNVLACKLSGGMKRRLNICLALVHDPEILVLDEPEAGLDPQSRLLVREFILSLKKEKTILLTTHNMDEADRLADRVAIIDHGKLLLLDTPDQLKKSIGEGDILEVVPEPEPSQEDEELISKLGRNCEKVTINGTSLVLRSRDIINRVPEITTIMKEHGFRIREITLRENTLEDVFIQLTGRKLRQ